MRQILVALLLALVLPAGAFAAEQELVMFGSKGCVYCRIFDREVAPNYTWSQAAARAPLRRIDIEGSGTGGYSLKTDITVTPTFVMFRHGREVGRIPGYPGKQNFYRIVERMLAR